VKQILIIILLLAAHGLHAGDPPAALLETTTTVEYNGKKIVTTKHVDILINEPEGDEYGEIAIRYSDMQKLGRVRAMILDRYGNKVRTISKGEMTDRSAISSISFYEDEYVMEFTAKHNVYPYRVVYSYTLQEDEFISFAYWVPVLDIDIPTRRAVLKLEVPSGTGMDYGLSAVGEPEVQDNGKTTLYTWQTSYEGIPHGEIYAPHYAEIYPWVDVFPTTFLYDQPGTCSNWTEFGNWVCDLNEGLDELPQSEQIKIDALVKNEDHVIDKVKSLYDHLQEETRYVNISLETGGYKPYPADYVAEKKYGDCKALTNYFRSVLSYAGIPSCYSLVYAGNRKKMVDTSLVTTQFNHAILMVPVNGDTLWLDCTTKRPFGEVSTFIHDRKALVVKRDDSRFAQIPAVDNEELVRKRTVRFELTMNGGLKGEFSTKFTGRDFDRLHSLHRSINRNTKEYILRNFFVAPGFDPLENELYYPSRNATDIELKVAALSSTSVRKYGNDMIFDVLPLEIPDFEKPGNRNLDVMIAVSILREDSLVYEVPANWKVTGVPQDTSITSAYGDYDLRLEVQDSTICVTKKIAIPAATILIDDYKNFYEFIHGIRTLEHNNNLVFIKP